MTIEKKENLQLILTITEHDVLGPLVEPHIVEITNYGQFSLTPRKINPLNLSDYSIDFSEVDKEIIEMADQYSIENLISKFSKKKVLPSEYYRSLDENTLNLYIRPYIEKKLQSIFPLLAKNNTSLYYKGRKKDAVQESPKKILNVEGQVVFNFDKSDEGTKYFLTLKIEDNHIELTGKQVILFTHKPCWLMVDNIVLAVDSRVDANKLKPFITKEFISVPARSEKKYYGSFVQNAVSAFEVNAKGFKIHEIQPIIKTFLNLENTLSGEVMFSLEFSYNDYKARSHEKKKKFIRLLDNQYTYIFEIIRRDLSFENHVVDYLLELGLKKSGNNLFTLASNNNSDIYMLVEWLNQHHQLLLKKDIIINQNNLKSNYYLGEISLEFSIKDKTDWFDIMGTVQFGKYKIPFLQLKNHILNGIREYVLPHGEIAILPEVWFSKYNDMLRFSKPSGKEGLQLKKHHFMLIEEFRGNNILEELRSLHNSENSDKYHFSIPEHLSKILRPYQSEGFKWMWLLNKYKLGGCLADDMGLGKTLQTLTVLSSVIKPAKNTRVKNKKIPVQLNLFADNFPVQDQDIEGIKTSLIVMPLSLIHNWENEIRKFTPDFVVYRHTGTNRTQDLEEFSNYDIVLTTYGIIRNDLALLEKINWFYIVLDESQVMKNPSSKIFRSLNSLNSKHRLVLTGTPVENSLTDLWAQLSFLNEGLLGSLNYFRNEFVIPIEKYKSEEKEKKLKSLIEPFILRRTKNLVAKELPSLTEKVYYCEMSEKQKEIYEEKKSEIRKIILENLSRQGLDKSRFVILKGLMQLRLLANHPRLAIPGYDHDSGKFVEALRTIESLMAEGHKVLIYSQFVKHLRIFKEHFDDQQFMYSYLTGEISRDKRIDIITSFQENPENKLFLISLKAGGVGLNLTSADYVFLLDPWWNPAVENQAIARAHRIGQENKVIAYKFISRGTIEEKIIALQNKKSDLANLFINTNNPLKFFDKETVADLLA
ncbi:MAG: DEAD/DEAH box helicase [bacterium]